MKDGTIIEEPVVIEDYQVSGAHDARLTAYINVFKKLGRSLKTAAVSCWTSAKEKVSYSAGNFVDTAKFHGQQLAKPIGGLLLVGALVLGSTACSIVPNRVQQEQVMEYDDSFTWTTREGVWLSHIAAWAGVSQSTITDLNGHVWPKSEAYPKGDPRAIVRPGVKIRIPVHFSLANYEELNAGLKNFGYVIQKEEITEWEQMEYFINCCTDQMSLELYDSFHSQEVFMMISTKKKAIEDYQRGYSDNFDPNYISMLEAEITDLYIGLVASAGAFVGKTYGEDFKLTGDLVLVEISRLGYRLS